MKAEGAVLESREKSWGRNSSETLSVPWLAPFRIAAFLVCVAGMAVGAAMLGSPARAEAPTLTQAYPSSLRTAATHEMVVEGSGFEDGATLELRGDERTISSMSTNVISPTDMEAVVSIPSLAPEGRYDVVVTNPDGGRATLTDRVRLYSPTDIFSHITPKFDCVELDEETGAASAHFGHTNTSYLTLDIPYGVNNFFTRVPRFRGQALRFPPGFHDRSFEVAFAEGESKMTWHLLGVSATADRDKGPFCDAPISYADLRVSQTSSEPDVVGEELEYTVTATNDGPLPATGVVLTNDLPGGVEFVSATSSKGECSGEERVVCSVGSLAWGESANVEIVVRPERAGDFVNAASVHAEQRDRNTSNNVSTLRTTVAARSAPSVESVNPDEGTRGETARIEVSGSGFADGARAALVRGSARLGIEDEETNPEGNSLSGELSIPEGFSFGEYDIEVGNPDGQTGVLEDAFSVVALPAPSISSVSPGSGNLGQSVDLRLEGSGLRDDSSVRLTLGNASIRASSTSLENGNLTARVEIPSGAALGDYDIEIRNPDGQKSVLEGGFSVAALPAPSISRVSPNESLRGRNVEVSVEGSNLREGASVSLDGAVRLRSSSVSVGPSGSLTATFSIPSAMPVGSYALEVRNPDGREAARPNAFTVTAPTATRTTLNPGFASIQRGRAVNRVGRLFAPGESVANRRVVLYQRVVGTRVFRPIRVTTTGPAGGYVFRGLRPQRTTFYQVRFAGSDELRASNSPVRRVVVRR